MTKRLFALWLTLLLAAAAAGCSPAAEQPAASESAAAASPPVSAAPDVLDAGQVLEDEAAAESSSPHAVAPADVGIQAGTSADYTENVLRSSAVHVRDDVIYLAYRSQLIRADLNADREPQTATIMMEMMPTINSLAGDEKDLYFATNDGIYVLPIDVLLGADLESAKLLSEYDVSTTPFYLWEDWLFFLYDNAVYVMPKAGGDAEILAEGAVDFQVTDRGLFCTNANGELSFLSFEDGETMTVIDSDCGGRIGFLEDTAYVTTGKEEPRLYSYTVPDRQVKEIVLTTTLSATHGAWTEPGALVCQSDDGRVVLYDLGANSETELGEYNMPYYEYGELANDILYSMAGDELTWMHLDSGQTGLMAMQDLLPEAESSEASAG